MNPGCMGAGPQRNKVLTFSPYTTREQRHPTHISIFEVLEDPYSFWAGSGHGDDIHIENGADLIHIPGYLARAHQAGEISKSPSL